MSVSFAQQNGNASSILRNELLQDAASLCNSAASHARIVILLSASSISSSSNSFWRSVIAFLLDLQPSHKLACSSFCSSRRSLSLLALDVFGNVNDSVDRALQLKIQDRIRLSIHALLKRLSRILQVSSD